VGGGAVQNGGGATTRTDLNNVTIAGNVADDDANATGDGGGIANLFGVVILSNSIVANNTDKGGQAPDCAAASPDALLTRRGYNLIRDPAGCAFGGSGDSALGYQTGVDPLLGALTTTSSSLGVLPLQGGSPAINAGHPAAPGSADVNPTCARVDQLGAARGPAGSCDLGAAEFVAPPPAVVPPAGTPFDLAAAIKKCKKKFKGKRKAKKRKKCIKRARAQANA
jgi:hypothetical protein